MKRSVVIIFIILRSFGMHTVHSVELFNETTVMTQSITLGDICGGISDPELLQTVIATAPLPGGYCYIARRDIERRFANRGLVFTGAEKIRVMRKGFQLDWDRVTRELDTLIRPMTENEIEIQLKSSKRVFFIDSAEYRLVFHPIREIGGYMTVNTDIITAFSRRTIALSVYIAVYKNVIVPVSRINRHERLENTLFKTIRVDCADSLYLANIDSIHSFRAKRSLEPGKPIRFDAIEKIPDVIKGKNVMIMFSSKSLQVELNATALADAYIGETVSVKLMTGKIMNASVSDKGMAVIREGL